MLACFTHKAGDAAAGNGHAALTTTGPGGGQIVATSIHTTTISDSHRAIAWE